MGENRREKWSVKFDTWKTRYILANGDLQRALPLHHFQKTLEPHLYLSFPSHSKAKSSEINGTFCNNQREPVK
jgi:hypothetical protein